MKQAKVVLTLSTIFVICGICSLENGWAYIEPYIASTLYSYNPDMTLEKVQAIWLISFFSEFIGANLFRFINPIFNYRETRTIALLIFSFGLFLVYIHTNEVTIAIFILCYGIQEGLRVVTSLFTIIGIMPHNIGLAAALTNLGATFGNIYWSMMAFVLINPNDQTPTISVLIDKSYENYFGPEIIANMDRFF